MTFQVSLGQRLPDKWLSLKAGARPWEVIDFKKPQAAALRAPKVKYGVPQNEAFLSFNPPTSFRWPQTPRQGLSGSSPSSILETEKRDAGSWSAHSPSSPPQGRQPPPQPTACPSFPSTSDPPTAADSSPNTPLPRPRASRMLLLEMHPSSPRGASKAALCSFPWMGSSAGDQDPDLETLRSVLVSVCSEARDGAARHRQHRCEGPASRTSSPLSVPRPVTAHTGSDHS